MPIKLSSIKNEVTLSAHDQYVGSVHTICYFSYTSWGMQIQSLFNNPPTGSYFFGDKTPGTYMQIDLPSKYYLYNYSFAYDDNCLPKSFTFEGSNNLNYWKILDNHDNYQYSSQDCQYFNWVTFKIKKPKSYKYYRMKLKPGGGSSTTYPEQFRLLSFDAVILKSDLVPQIKCSVPKYNYISKF